ncbi:HEPN domain-containing protein [uncultured Thiodictyon sp.]|uniref:HEPN domain-containing protein n=1 Tax=uncultured Thiodictyon sp. TaxID=1846217 RepID=UPI0025F18804|nr:HEPN domain-containing protein [uncultured Thiodictyon sp.]
MSPDEYLAKARRALASARLLLADGDLDGACNRAYYAMFDAAQAAVETAQGMPVRLRRPVRLKPRPPVRASSHRRSRLYRESRAGSALQFPLSLWERAG